MSRSSAVRSYARRRLTSPVYWATIDPASTYHQEWLQLFGAGRVPVLDPEPDLARAGQGDPRLYYRVDVPRLTGDQRVRLAGFLAARWVWTVSEVLALLDEPGVGLPVLAEGVTVGIDARLLR